MRVDSVMVDEVKAYDRKGSRVAMSTDSYESPLLELIFFPFHLTRLLVSGVFEFVSMHP